MIDENPPIKQHPIAILYQIRHLQHKVNKQPNPDLRKVLESRLQKLEAKL